jgi:hypothetical protein
VAYFHRIAGLIAADMREQRSYSQITENNALTIAWSSHCMEQPLHGAAIAWSSHCMEQTLAGGSHHCMEQTLAGGSHHCMEQTLAGGSHHCMEQTLAGGSHEPAAFPSLWGMK